MPDTEPGTMHAVVEEQIRASIDRVFPLCCPVQEYLWIDGWACELVHCPNDRVEAGCVFREFLSAPFLQGAVRAETTWTAVQHDPQTHRLHFEVVNAISRSLYRIELDDAGQGETMARLDFTYTACNEEGERVIADHGAARLRVMLGIVGAMLRRYAETGRKLGPLDLFKSVLQTDALTFTDRLRMVGNRLALALRPDPQRQRLLGLLAVRGP
jgi:hypothetical protein